jgi:hypothetical protein
MQEGQAQLPGLQDFNLGGTSRDQSADPKTIHHNHDARESQLVYVFFKSRLRIATVRVAGGLRSALERKKRRSGTDHRRFGRFP